MVSHVVGTHSAKPQAHAAVCSQAVTLNYSLPGSGQYSEESVSVLPMETVSSANVTRSSSSMSCSACAYYRLAIVRRDVCDWGLNKLQAQGPEGPRGSCRCVKVKG